MELIEDGSYLIKVNYLEKLWKEAGGFVNSNL